MEISILRGVCGQLLLATARKPLVKVKFPHRNFTFTRGSAQLLFATARKPLVKVTFSLKKHQKHKVFECRFSKTMVITIVIFGNLHMAYTKPSFLGTRNHRLQSLALNFKSVIFEVRIAWVGFGLDWIWFGLALGLG